MSIKLGKIGTFT